MSLNLAFLMSRLALKDIEILEIDDLPIAFSPKEFIEIMDNMRELPMIFDDVNMKRIDEPKREKGMICKSFLQNHGHCIICFIRGYECYPLDLWKCIDENIGKIKKGEW